MIIIQYLLLAELLWCYALQKNFEIANLLEKDAAAILEGNLPSLKRIVKTTEHFIPRRIPQIAKLENFEKMKSLQKLHVESKPSLGKWFQETGEKFDSEFAEKDTIEQIQMIGNTVGPTVNMLPKESETRNNTKKALSVINAAALLKDLAFDPSSRKDPVHILKRIVWSIGPSFDILGNGPEKLAISNFIMGTNALHLMSTEKQSFSKKTLVNKVRKLVDDFIYNIADNLAPGPLKEALYMAHRGVHAAALMQNYKEIYALGPRSEDALRSLGTSLKTLPDGPLKQILRQIIGGLRSMAMVRNPW